MLPIPTLMQSLSQSRPIFHSEADFQHALAWEVQKAFPQAQIRLELPVVVEDARMTLDIWAAIDGRRYAVELKYKKRLLDVTIGSERFRLKNDAAHDQGRYDFIKDIGRLEQIVAAAPDVEGYAVLLTNDSAYWGGGGATAADAAFRLPEGRVLADELRWGSGASAGTTATRERPLRLRGSYTLAWADYSQVGTARLRWLGVHVQTGG